MILNGFDVYKIYLALKLHFTNDTYDYFKYDGRVNCKLETFTKRNDRYFFHKLSTKYNRDAILDYFVGNFLSDSKKWIGDISRGSGKEIYDDFRKRKESFTYFFRSDCQSIYNIISDNNISYDDVFKITNGQHPRIFKLYLSKKICVETFVVFEKILGFMRTMDKSIKEHFIWPEHSKKIRKYMPFVKFNETQCKLIMKEVFLNASKSN